MNKLHVGTSGWSYDHWKEVFYPKDLASENYLDFYQKHFDCVELNTSFYHLPKHQMILDWNEKTEDDFFFCPKVSRYITHQKKLNDFEEPLRNFLERFRPMKKKLGLILVQFPSQIKLDNPNIEKFLSFTRKFWSWKFAVEARHESWISNRTKELLQEKKAAWVIANSGGHYPEMKAVIGDTVYLRFHGPGELYASKYDKKTLSHYAKKAEKWLSEGKEVWAFFNNDHQGYAVENAKTFREML
ncbi:MAG: DUF72 domain-containing protein [Chlamydiales bacterium]